MKWKCKTIMELKKENKPYAEYYSGEEVYLDETKEVPFLRFSACKEMPWMDLAFSTRAGGVSEGYLSSLNLGWDRGEPRENVCENYKRVCKALGGDYRKLVLSDQIHETKVVYAEESLCGGENIEKKLKGVDGLVTDKPGLILATSYADCVPLFFLDDRKKIIASSHSGWKGTVAKIAEETIDKMKEMGSDCKDIVVVVGPSICQECYEVSEDVAQQFLEAYGEKAGKDILKKGRVMPDGEQKYQLDLWAANWHQLKQAGLLEENIHISGLCTCCNPKFLYSHRASQGKRGNLNGFIRIL